MPDTLLTLIPQAAADELLGGLQAFADVTPTSNGTTTTIISTDLIDPSGAQTYKNWRAYCYEGTLAGEERLITGVDLATGTLTTTAFTGITTTTCKFWLLRNFRRNEWRDFANRSLKTMKRRVIVAIQGIASQVRYSAAQLATLGIERPEDVIDIGTRAYPEVNTEGNPTPVSRFDWESNDGSISLVLPSAVGTSQELVFYVSKPFASSGQTIFTTDADTTTAPFDWLVSEMVERALRAMWSRATDADRPRWLALLRSAIVENEGYRKHYLPMVGRRVFGIWDPGW